MTKIESLENVPFEIMADGFSRAFNDYEVQITKAQLKSMLKRRSYNAELSFGAFENDRLISFTFNGIGIFNGIKTAYDTGTGTDPEYRGKGLASKIFEHSIPYLQETGIKQYLLEVLQNNTKAVSIYSKASFKVSREFYYSVINQNEIKLLSKSLSPNYQLKSISLEEAKAGEAFFDSIPAWQNNFNAVFNQPEDFETVGVFYKDQLVAFGICEPENGDITLVGVDKAHRRKGIGTVILFALQELNKYSSMKVINYEVGCKSVYEFLKANSFYPTGKQFEMTRAL